MENITKALLKKLKLNESTISMILGILVVVAVGVLVFNYFGQGIEEELKPEEISIEEPTVEIEKEKGLPTTHKVRADENLWSIANEYYNDGYKWTEIAQVNKLTNPDLVSPGQELSIPNLETAMEEPQEVKPESKEAPITGKEYTVKKGDCLWFIALKAYGDPYKWVEIARVNNLTNPDLIHQGNKLVLSR